jgi:hypothetical protein
VTQTNQPPEILGRFNAECVSVTDNAVYLETLLRYYEEEVMGEAYFH